METNIQQAVEAAMAEERARRSVARNASAARILWGIVLGLIGLAVTALAVMLVIAS